MIISSGVSQIDFSSIQQYNINSDVDSLNAADTTSNFNVKLDIDWYGGIDRISVGDLAVPKSYYIVNSTNNTFEINEGGLPETITIPIGNYTTVASLCTAINNAIAITTATATYTFSAVPNPVGTPNVGKIQVSVTANPVANTFLVFNNTFYEIIGAYGPNEGNAGRTPLNAGIAVTILPYVYNLNAYNNMYLLCDMVSGNNSQSTSNILCAIYPHETALFNYNASEFDILSKSKQIAKKSNTMNFKIVDQFKNPVDFNGIAVSFSLYLFKLKKV